MYEFLSNLVYRLVGDPRLHSMEHRLFSTITLLFGIANLGGSLNYIDFDAYPVFLFAAHVFVGSVFIVFYFLSRVKSFYWSLYWPFVLMMIAFLYLSMTRDGGSKGGTHYYLILTAVVAVILGRDVWSMVLSALMVAAAGGALFYMEIFHPEMIMPFPGSEEERLMELASQFIFVMLFTSFIVEILSRNLEQERRKSDRLLLNVLPESVAGELKKTDRVEPRHYDGATVLFTDFVGFTRIAERLSPEELIGELDRCFSYFDSLTERYNLEKLKTIGDAFMCAGGIPQDNRTHAIDCALVALEIRDFMQSMKEIKSDQNFDYWELRIGMASGPLVAGVIGEKKFAYDVWGDTVNTASRMESSGTTGRVNISRSTYDLVADFFDCEYRGKIDVKNKGLVEMYYLNGIKPELSVNGECRVPNDMFRDSYGKLQ